MFNILFVFMLPCMIVFIVLFLCNMLGRDHTTNITPHIQVHNTPPHNTQHTTHNTQQKGSMLMLISKTHARSTNKTNKKNRFELKTTNKTKSSANFIKTVNIKMSAPTKHVTQKQHNEHNHTR